MTCHGGGGGCTEVTPGVGAVMSTINIEAGCQSENMPVEVAKCDWPMACPEYRRTDTHLGKHSANGSRLWDLFSDAA